MSEHPPAPRRFPGWVVPSGLLALVVALLVWAAPTLYAIFSRPEVVRDWIAGWGPWAPAAFVFLQILQVVVFVLPGEFTQIAGGWLFGFGLGSVLSILGILIGSSIAFGLTRGLGVSFVHRIAGKEAVSKFDSLMASPKLVGSLFLLFLIPGIPKDILCYVAGLSRLKFVPFLLISTAARLPGILGSSLMGKAFVDQDWTLLASVAGGALVLFGLGWWFRDSVFAFIERFAVAQPAPKEESHEPR